MKTVIDAPLSPSFYDPQLEKLGFSDGDCVIFSYNVNFSDEINSDYQTTGIVQGTISQVSLIDQWPCTPYILHDSTTLIENEQPVAYAISTSGPSFYFSEKLFLTSDFKHETEQKTSWNLYYDPDLPTEEVEGKTVYSFFLRAVMRDEGKSPTINGGVINVYNAGNFFKETSRIEKGKGKSEVYFIINHIKEIKEDGVFTWEKSELCTNPIPEED
ncbi:MAG: hypothetical protein LBJ58_00190 [Tannerellaceae bacterium]|nr:hypothetical protein [Tannerellaceae bacterium]